MTQCRARSCTAANGRNGPAVLGQCARCSASGTSDMCTLRRRGDAASVLEHAGAGSPCLCLRRDIHAARGRTGVYVMDNFVSVCRAPAHVSLCSAFLRGTPCEHGSANQTGMRQGGIKHKISLYEFYCMQACAVADPRAATLIVTAAGWPRLYANVKTASLDSSGANTTEARTRTPRVTASACARARRVARPVL